MEATLFWVGKAVGMEVVWKGVVCSFEKLGRGGIQTRVGRGDELKIGLSPGITDQSVRRDKLAEM